ncbi:MAG: 3-deoxy-D-manno-octulosonic acid transferase [Candidatus Omnitrophica bacterium]|nr:3-deoxy-D-manno-octulosonic acid transferase [Candidatus Omnitrophota bacterium]
MRYLFSAIYDIFYGVVLFLSLPVFGKRLFGRDRHYHDFLERFGIYNKALLKSRITRNIWIHAVSIGELLASLPLILEISQKFKDRQIVVSCVSRTGRLIAEQKLADNIIKIFMPFDFSFSVHRAVSAIKPEIFISMETELWPNLFIELKRHNTSIVILNGRISEKSFKRYSAFKILIRRTVNMVDCFVMRSFKDAQRVIGLGADREKVFISKSIKFDQAYRLSQTAKGKSESRMIVFGSIHPGEEEPVSEIIKKILDRYRDVSIIIVPRSLDKTSIYQILRRKDIQYERLSSSYAETRVLIVDRYGVLNEFYKKSNIVFVGGSLVPAGGHNPIEPLAFKNAVIYGKFHWDFEEEWKKILEAGGGFEVGSFEELCEKIEFLLDNPQIRDDMGDAGFRVILENRGATEDTLRIIGKYIAGFQTKI